MRRQQHEPIFEIIGRDVAGHSLHMGEFSTLYVKRVKSELYLVNRDEYGAEQLICPAYQSAKLLSQSEKPRTPQKTDPIENSCEALTLSTAAPFVFENLVQDGQLPRPLQDNRVWDRRALSDALAKLKKANSK